MDERPSEPDRLLKTLAALITAAVLLVPVAVMPDLLDRFHVVKESLMRAEAFVSAFLLAAAMAFGGRVRFRQMAGDRFLFLAIGSAVAWTCMATVTSTDRTVSVDSLVSVVASALVFFAVWYAAPAIGTIILDLLVVAAAINAALAALQEFAMFDPFLHDDPNLPQHLKATGLIGNPNVVGSWMALAAVILAVACTRFRGWRRLLYAMGALIAGAGVLVSLTRTALIALVLGLLMLAIGFSMRRAIPVIVALTILLGAGVAFRIPVVMRVLDLPRLAADGTLESATSGRVAPALAAWMMFRDHPWTGVGPGAYHSGYTAYKARVWEHYGNAIRGTSPTTFGDAHNDHLQMLAETGLPGYGLFLTVVVASVAAAVRGTKDDWRGRFARTLAVPLAATFLVLALAQFPLHLAVTRHLLVTFAGLAVGWSRPWD